MNKLLKRFKVLHIGNRMILPLTEQGDSAEVYPGGWHYVPRVRFLY